MVEYTVTWEINIEADTPKEAVREALLIQKDPNSIATVFSVQDEELCETYTIDGSD